MEEQLIKFNTARLAKQRGFNAPCHTYYEVDKEPWLFHTVNAPVDYNHVYKDVEDARKLFSAPHQGLLQKWLRDVHKIHVHMYSIHLQDGSGYKWSVDVYNLKKLNEEEYIIMTGHALSDGIKDTYEEALEMGLDAALRIEILWKTN